jgi:hypothetical protein
VEGSFFVENRKPGKAMVGTDLIVDESILTIAPSSENEQALRIAIDHTMSPPGRYDDLFSRTCRYREAKTRLIPG